MALVTKAQPVGRVVVTALLLVAAAGVLSDLVLQAGVLCAVVAWADVRFGAPPRSRDLAWAVLLMVPLALFDLGVLWVVVAAVSQWAPEALEEALFGDLEPLWYFPERSLMANALAGASVVVLIPVMEESIFRGWLLPAWSRRWGVRVGIVATSVAFGVLHGATALGGASFGIVGALLYLRSGSLAVPIAAHVTMNAIAASGDLFSAMDPDADMTAREVLESFRSAWWIGASGLLIGSPVVGRFVVTSWRIVTRREPAQEPPGGDG